MTTDTRNATAATDATDATSEADAAGGRPGTDAPAGVFLVLAELGLLAAALGTAAGFSRLFIGWSFLGTLAVPLIACWASTLLLRRLRVPMTATLAISVVLAAVVLTWRFAPGTSFVGIPTSASASALRQELQASFGDFSRLVAPVQATDGFLVVLALILWVFGLFADTATFRYRGPVQAVIPYGATFVAAGILARDAARGQAALLFVAGMATYVVTQRALQASERRWIRGESGRGTWAVAATGGALAVVAVLAGALVGPRLPGDTQAVIDLRSLGRGGGSRTVVSPFVGVRSLLGPQSDDVVFTVQADTASYWRLTSLEQYDPTRDIWISRGTYRRVDGDLDPTLRSGIATTPLHQTVRIGSLGGLWLPAAFQAVHVDGDLPVSYDRGSSSIIARDESLERGVTYSVDSVVAQPTTTDLGASNRGERLDAVYTQTAGVSDEVRRQAEEITAGPPTPLLKAQALQDWFRSKFRYTTDVDYRNDPDPVLAFLTKRRGFCQQFASAFALMARAVGLPARVAVGFTQGEQTAELPGSKQPGFIVRGRYAHAWPEVYFDGVGWVPFEPTTGRGNPQATAYTGVPAQQADPPPSQASTTTAPTTTAPVATTPSTTPAGGVDAVSDPGSTDVTGSGSPSGFPWWIWPVAVAVLVGSVGLVRLGRDGRRRRRLRADPHGGRIAAAWDDAVHWLAVLDLHPAPEETPLEFAARTRATTDLDAEPDAGLPGDDGHGPRSAGAGDALRELAWAETGRRFGAGDPGPQRCESAEAAAVVVRDRVRSMTSRTRQVRHLVG